MALSENERHIFLFNLHVEMVPKEVPDEEALTIPLLLETLQRLFKEGKASRRIGERIPDDDEKASKDEDKKEKDEDEDKENPNVIFIKSIEIADDGTATLLLHHGDAQAPDPALINIQTGDVRTAGKKKNEGSAHAAHLVISTKKHVSVTGQCRAQLERVPNLGRTTVMRFLNILLREDARERHLEYTDKKTKKQHRFHPKLISQEQLSAALKADIEEGRLHKIELIRRKHVPGFDESDRVVPEVQRIVHKVVNVPKGEAAWDLLEKVRNWARAKNFDEVQVRFTKESTDQQLSPRLATDIADAADAVYVRLEVLGNFPEPLAQCPKKIVPELRKRMMKLFEKKDLWR